eukprot:TRINITY_DN8660_c0_g1_i1.p1 TRINITY_DN8660_c0_g1~~TRINITY_DN8660_c0_g1_i1.p1  ORF type:complete len:540 (+),score=96.02 TRINITY_DN8660_c0_g1_i1:65-1684(+)
MDVGGEVFFILVCVGGVLLLIAAALVGRMLFTRQCVRRGPYVELQGDEESGGMHFIQRHPDRKSLEVGRRRGNNEASKEALRGPASENMLLDAQFFLRSSVHYTFVRAVHRVGSRPNKHYVIVRHIYEGERILEVLPKGPTCSIAFGAEASNKTFRGLLLSLKHPFLYPVEDAQLYGEKNMALVFRRWQGKGSLRDYICRATPKDLYTKKYVTGDRIQDAKIARFGRQILEALKFLKKRGFPMPHLHTANVIMDKGMCKLTDIENSLLCLPPLYQDKLRPYSERADMEVVCFGFVLYEMAVGQEADTSPPSYYPPTMPRPIRAILENIFLSPEGSRVTVEDLLADPFFKRTDVEIRKEKIRLDSRMKDMIMAAARAGGGFTVGMPSSAPSSTPSSPRSSIDGGPSAEDLPIVEPRKEKRRSRSRRAVEPGRVPDTNTLVPPPPLAPLPPSGPSSSQPPLPKASGSRKNLLGSIEGFNKGALKQSATNDRSAPIVGTSSNQTNGEGSQGVEDSASQDPSVPLSMQDEIRNALRSRIRPAM